MSDFIGSNNESQPGNPNQEFVFADAGNDEYLILNRGTGTYMTANSETDAPVTGNLLPPVDERVRWKVVPVRSGSGAYNVAYPDLVMDTFRAGTDNETPIVLWTNNGEQNQQFFLRLP
ncbi:uncharacterized protein BO95DRAFT_465516 [Aspergillus brunneoviolaceus CBS 621.78]|uniref:Uncharacterized protein n=1 Tax=Aspergillus brunneoviolaceus CBS 621.78 TaxID=1450534 RepID=A0ACD1G3H8_9EURO|nr:hypothetical protein BO95DRAFT_465516 [Aspergillus brunneoviolaceus CBS 621.78]RAH43787.1 hypothetical protein BO95DRAFT_465516 [Aspergillus brunneoviolaceus CBS 621.78]